MTTPIRALSLCLPLLAFVFPLGAGIAHNPAAAAEGTVPGAEAGLGFALRDHIGSTAVFHWFEPGSGHQMNGPWEPLEARGSWTGETEWWRGQIKQIMMANFDLLWVHMIDFYEETRINLFQALADMRAEGWDVPPVAPFLDPTVIWVDEPPPDLATEEGVDEYVGHIIRFYEQYYAANTDAAADQYIGVIDGRVAMNFWHMYLHTRNVHSLTREGVERRLAEAFGQEHPVFNNGVYLTTTALSHLVPTWQDEKIAEFEIVEHYRFIDHLGIVTFKIAPGNWDQNVRSPGNFLPRDGGNRFREAWRHLHVQQVDRVFVESWNELDEGTGIYAARPEPPHISEEYGNPNTDVWSNNGDPFEYILQTAENLSRWNSRPELDAVALRHSLPSAITVGQMVTAEVVMRNAGDQRWQPGDHRLAMSLEPLAPRLSADVRPFDAERHEVDLYRGVFRGRPVTFEVTLLAPNEPGDHETVWRMFGPDGEPFGQGIRHMITVNPAP